MPNVGLGAGRKITETFSVDFSVVLIDNQNMTSTIPSDVLADMERATELAISGKKDPEFERRVQAEAKKIREEILKKHGLLDIGVPAIRQLRDDE